MKFGINIPNFGWFGDIDTLVDIAVEVEESGWDGFFLCNICWDGRYGDGSFVGSCLEHCCY